MAGSTDPRRTAARGDPSWGESSSQGASSLYDDDSTVPEEDALYKHGVGNAGDVSEESSGSDQEWDEERGGPPGGGYGASPEKEPMLGGTQRTDTKHAPSGSVRDGGGGRKKPKASRNGKPPVKQQKTKSWFAWGDQSSGSDGSSEKVPKVSHAREAELTRKAQARDALRRKAERRLYRPASFVLLGKLSLMWLGLILLTYACIFLSALVCFLNPYAVVLDGSLEYLWSVVCCLSLLGVPSMLTHLCGYVFLPPVWPEQFPEREKVLEELGGCLLFRFYHVRGLNRPQATKQAVDTAVEVLSRTLPNTLWEVEVVTERDLFLENASVKEFVYPEGRVGPGGPGWVLGSGRDTLIRKSWFRSAFDRMAGLFGGLDGTVSSSNTGSNTSQVTPCQLLSYAAEVSAAGWGDWVVHLGPDGILNQRAVDAVLVHCARESRLSALASSSQPRARRLAQGSVMPGITRTANSLDGGVPTMAAWPPAMAEVLRAGESAGAMHLAYSRGTVGPALAASPGRFLVVPNEMERLVGWSDDGTPPGSEHTAFALRCKHRGAQFAWLDAGVHVPVTKGFWSLFKQRARENAALAQLLMEDSSDLTKRLDPTTQTMLATTCVSSVFAKLAPVCVSVAPFIKHAGTREAFFLACFVGATGACQFFIYAIGFYVSSGARHLATGAPGYVCYLLLFAVTFILVPVFSAFELLAVVFAPFFAAKRTKIESSNAKKDVNGSPPVRSGGSDTSVGSDKSDDLIGSDGEVRRWKSRGGSRRRGDRGGSQTFTASLEEGGFLEENTPDAATATARAVAAAANRPPSQVVSEATTGRPSRAPSSSSSGFSRPSSRADRWLKNSAPVAKR